MGTDPLSVFERVGRLVDERWRQRNYDEAVFPDLAAGVLAELQPGRDVTALDLLAWVLRTDTLPHQFDPDSKFGQPPLTMYRAPRFVIDALFWMESTTDIHQHGFAGAFAVLAGSSVHSQYEFELGERISAAMLIGSLRFRGFEILGPGDIRTIGAGKALIHALFHLEQPSVTIVIRTYRDTEAGPQYLYYPPTLAIDPFFEDPLLARRLEALDVLAKLDLVAYEQAVGELFAHADLFAVFRVARHHLGRVQSLERLRALLERARPRHGARVELLPQVLEELARLRAIADRRKQLQGADHRFFLAMLLNLPTRQAILEAVTQRYPGAEPVDLVMQWIQDLAAAIAPRSALAGDDHTAAILAEMLRGHAGEELIARLKEDFDDDDVERLRPDIIEIERSMRTAPMLRPLFRN